MQTTSTPHSKHANRRKSFHLASATCSCSSPQHEATNTSPRLNKLIHNGLLFYTCLQVTSVYLAGSKLQRCRSHTPQVRQRNVEVHECNEPGYPGSRLGRGAVNDFGHILIAQELPNPIAAQKKMTRAITQLLKFMSAPLRKTLQRLWRLFQFVDFRPGGDPVLLVPRSFRHFRHWLLLWLLCFFHSEPHQVPDGARETKLRELATLTKQALSSSHGKIQAHHIVTSHTLPCPPPPPPVSSRRSFQELRRWQHRSW